MSDMLLFFKRIFSKNAAFVPGDIFPFRFPTAFPVPSFMSAIPAPPHTAPGAQMVRKAAALFAPRVFQFGYSFAPRSFYLRTHAPPPSLVRCVSLHIVFAFSPWASSSCARAICSASVARTKLYFSPQRFPPRHAAGSPACAPLRPAWPLAAAQTDGDAVFQPAHKVRKVSINPRSRSTARTSFPGPPQAPAQAAGLFRSAPPRRYISPVSVQQLPRRLSAGEVRRRLPRICSKPSFCASPARRFNSPDTLCPLPSCCAPAQGTARRTHSLAAQVHRNAPPCTAALHPAAWLAIL